MSQPDFTSVTLQLKYLTAYNLQLENLEIHHTTECKDDKTKNHQNAEKLGRIGHPNIIVTILIILQVRLLIKIHYKVSSTAV